MEHVAIDDLDDWMGPADVKRPIGQALGTDHMGLQYYELAPGESTAFGYHAHENQEEVFYVLDGALAFETEEGEVTVGAGEAVHFAPGEFQRSLNPGEDRTRLLAIGAPADPGELTLLRDCRDCDERTDQTVEAVDDGAALVTLCEDCGRETGRFE